jgi:peptide deformylase
LLGWAIQHEVDHLNGVLFTERIRDLSTLRDYSKEEEPAITGVQRGASNLRPELKSAAG